MVYVVRILKGGIFGDVAGRDVMPAGSRRHAEPAAARGRPGVE